MKPIPKIIYVIISMTYRKPFLSELPLPLDPPPPLLNIPLPPPPFPPPPPPPPPPPADPKILKKVVCLYIRY